MHMRPKFAATLRALTVTASLLGIALASAVAHAGEFKFGAGANSLETDDSGKLTAAGAKSAVKQLDKIPGEDAWDLKIWIRIDRGAPGPLYIEFYQTVEGVESIVHRHEVEGYEGGKYVTDAFLLEGSQGFNKNHTYKVVAIQSDGDKDIKLAEGTIKLIKSEAPPAAAAKDGDKGEDKKEAGTDDGKDGGEGEGDEEECSAQDRLDGFCTGDEAKGGDGEPAADAKPPQTTDPAKQKGCAVALDSRDDEGAPALLLAVFGATAIARRSRRRSSRSDG